MASSGTHNDPPPELSPARRDRGSRLALLVANLLPLAGVVFLDWDLLSILLFYWIESLVRCAFAALRALLHSGLSGIGSIALFLPVVIVLAAAHMAVLVVLADAVGQAGPHAPDLSKASNAGLLTALGTIYQGAVAWILLERPSLLLLALPAEALYQLIDIGWGRRRAADRQMGSAQAILRQSLGAVVRLQIALLLGCVLIAVFQVPDLLPVLLVLVLFKCGLDLRQHRTFERSAPSSDPV